HGFAGGDRGSIVVELRESSAAELMLAVADDGVGLPEGFVLGRSRTLGHQLVETLAQQLGGRLNRPGGVGARLGSAAAPGAGGRPWWRRCWSSRTRTSSAWICRRP